MPKIQEVFSIVNQIQGEIYDQTDGNEEISLSLVSNGDIILVNFNDLTLWMNEDDMREYDEEVDEYEPLEVYLRREVNEKIRVLSKIKL